MNPKALEDPAVIGDPDAGSFGDQLEDSSVQEVQEQLVTGSMHSEVDVVLGKLTAREGGILRMRYGLDDGQPRTLEEIGVAFKVRSCTSGLGLCIHLEQWRILAFKLLPLV